MPTNGKTVICPSKKHQEAIIGKLKHNSVNEPLNRLPKKTSQKQTYKLVDSREVLEQVQPTYGEINQNSDSPGEKCPWLPGNNGTF